MSEQQLLSLLDAAVASQAIRQHVDGVLPTLEQRLRHDPNAIMSWEPIPLGTYGPLPSEIRSSWIFVLRAGITTGAERHPNSHQRMLSYRGSGEFPQQVNGEWVPHRLTSDPARPIEERWVSIPPYVWHKPIVDPGENWVVVSFHTVLAEELIEERPTEGGGVEQKLYLKH